MRKASSGGLVYSTEGGRMCPACRQPVAGCTCKQPLSSPPPKADAQVRVSRETKGRGGKAVTAIRGLPLDAAELSALGKRLRSACGSGGTVKDGVIELQGDHCERALDHLKQEGWTAKRSGG